MGQSTGIAWTNATWNPVRGCERVSEGCRNCYAEVLAARHSYEGGWGHEIAHYIGGRPRWTGVIETHARHLKVPLGWKTARRVFVNSMSDIFHERVPFNFVDDIYAVMAQCPQHVFQILTKRPARMLEYLLRAMGRQKAPEPKPLPNVWHGVSVEDQATAYERIPFLLQTPTAVRFISAEPLLGQIDLRDEPNDVGEPLFSYLERVDGDGPRIDWVILGGESGSEHRPMDMKAARWLIQQCKLAGVPVFVKQDSGPRPGRQGRFTNEEWSMKEYPA